MLGDGHLVSQAPNEVETFEVAVQMIFQLSFERLLEFLQQFSRQPEAIVERRVIRGHDSEDF